MPDARTWLEIAEACERADGPDRELDARLWWLTADHSGDDAEIEADVQRLGVPGAIDAWWGTQWRTRSDFRDRPPLLYTASTDAILALIAEKLPGWDCNLYTSSKRPCVAELEPPAPAEKSLRLAPPTGRAATPALALCAAFCRALAVQEDR